MDALATLLSSQTKAEILRLLFAPSIAPIHLRELARRTGSSFSAVQREIKKLGELGVICEQKDGNRTYITANRDHPLYSELTSIVRKSRGLIEMLRESLGPDGIEIAFIFGSFASATEGRQSDIDLMVIGEIGLREVVKRLAGVTDRLGREVNPHVFRASEFAERKRSKDHFVSTVMKQRKEFLIGDESELKGLAK